MEIKIDTNIAGVELHQFIKITGDVINQLDERVIQDQVVREITRAENELLKAIIIKGASYFN